jgi:hypothetical protein
MAEAKPVDPTRPAESSPKLVALPEDRTTAAAASRPQPGRHDPERHGVSWSAFGLAVALLLLAIIGLVVQTQRVSDQAEQIGLLNGQVEGLQLQLSAANTQLATYDMQLTLVRTTVAAMYEQMTNLNELVSTNPFAAEPSETPIGR